MATNNPIELLIALGVNGEKSKTNIQNYLNELSKNLKLDVTINGANNGTGTFTKINQEVKETQKAVESLGKATENVISPNLSKNANVTFKSFRGAIAQAHKELKGLQQAADKMMTPKVDTTQLEKDIKKAQRALKPLQEKLKNAQDAYNTVTAPKHSGEGSMISTYTKVIKNNNYGKEEVPENPKDIEPQKQKIIDAKKNLLKTAQDNYNAVAEPLKQLENELQRLLATAKKNVNLTNRQISSQLNPKINEAKNLSDQPNKWASAKIVNRPTETKVESVPKTTSTPAPEVKSEAVTATNTALKNIEKNASLANTEIKNLATAITSIKSNEELNKFGNLFKSINTQVNETINKLKAFQQTAKESFDVKPIEAYIAKLKEFQTLNTNVTKQLKEQPNSPPKPKVENVTATNTELNELANNKGNEALQKLIATIKSLNTEFDTVIAKLKLFQQNNKEAFDTKPIGTYIGKLIELKKHSESIPKVNIPQFTDQPKTKPVAQTTTQTPIVETPIVPTSPIKPTKAIPTGNVSAFQKEVLKSIDSVEKLKALLESKGMKYTLSMTYDKKGVEKLKKVTTEVKNEFGEISKLTITPKIDKKGVMSFRQTLQNLTNTDTHKLDEGIIKAYESLRKFARQGALSAEEYNKFSNAILNSKTNEELAKVVDKFKNIHAQATHVNKVANVMSNVSIQANELIQKLKQYQQSNKDAFDPKVVDKYIAQLEKLKNTKVATDKGANKLSGDLGNIEKQINDYTALQTKYADTTRYLNVMKQQGKITAEQFAKFSKDAKLAESVIALKALNTEIANTAKTQTNSEKIKQAYQGIGGSVDTLNAKLGRLLQSYSINPNNAALQGIKANIQEISNMKINSVADITKLNNLIAQTGKSIQELSNNAAHMKKFDNAVKNANAELTKMKESGLLTEKEIYKLTQSLARIKPGELNHVNNLLAQMKTRFEQVSKVANLEDSIKKSSRAVQSLEADFTKTMNVYKRSFDATSADKLKQKIQELKKALESLDKNDPKSANQFKKMQEDIDNLRVKVKQFHAESASASKNNMGVIDAFRTAMERFPIWMAASTAFYGVIRTGREFMDILVDIDTKLVSIQKVTGEGTDMGAIFERATVSAEQFG